MKRSYVPFLFVYFLLLSAIGAVDNSEKRDYLIEAAGSPLWRPVDEHDIEKITTVLREEHKIHIAWSDADFNVYLRERTEDISRRLNEYSRVMSQPIEAKDQREKLKAVKRVFDDIDKLFYGMPRAPTALDVLAARIAVTNREGRQYLERFNEALKSLYNIDRTHDANQSARAHFQTLMNELLVTEEFHRDIDPDHSQEAETAGNTNSSNETVTPTSLPPSEQVAAQPLASGTARESSFLVWIVSILTTLMVAFIILLRRKLQR